MKSPVTLICLLLLLSQGTALANQPRRSIPFHEINMKEFTASGFTNMSSMLMAQHFGQLIVGARGTVYSLNLEDISDKTSETNWIVSDSSKAQCKIKGKDTEECDNYIKVLHTTGDGRFLVCGTYAFQPQCIDMTFENGQLALNGKEEGSKGKVPFDPHQRHASLMTENALYSATYSNFLGTEPVFQKAGPNPLKSEFKRSWFNEPTFVSIQLVETSKNSEDGGDDSVFLFFTERAIEQQTDLLTSRIARVCKGDMGGQRTLQRKWTSFLKAHLDCPLGHPGTHSLVQDVFLLKDENGDWRESVFYAVFTSDPESSGTCSQSAVCAYKLADISQAFSGNFLSRQRSGRWDTYTGEVPVPRPGSCINNAIRAMGVTSSLDLPDRTLQFVKDHPLLENVIRPLTGKPLLVQKGTQFTKIVVDRVTSLDGAKHEIMFIGTDSGWLQKAVRFNGEDIHVIEELQLFKTPQPVSFLQLSSKTGQLYTGSSDVIVQIDVRDCSHYTSCSDCVRARNPYCGWVNSQCAQVHMSSESVIQSLTEGDTSMCPTSEMKMKPVVLHLDVGTSQLMTCSPNVNMPVNWMFPDRVVVPSDRHLVLDQGLLLTKVTKSDAGLYTCQTMETIKGKIYQQTVVQYLVQVQDLNMTLNLLRAAVNILSIFLGLVLTAGCRYLVTRCERRILDFSVGLANTNCNNQHQVTSADQDDNCEKVDELVNTQDSASSSEGSVTTETGSVDCVINIPEDTGVQQPEEVVMEQGRNNNNNDYVVIEIPEGS